jgi:hypothetical protein
MCLSPDSAISESLQVLFDQNWRWPGRMVSRTMPHRLRVTWQQNSHQGSYESVKVVIIYAFIHSPIYCISIAPTVCLSSSPGFYLLSPMVWSSFCCYFLRSLKLWPCRSPPPLNYPWTSHGFQLAYMGPGLHGSGQSTTHAGRCWFCHDRTYKD